MVCLAAVRFSPNVAQPKLFLANLAEYPPCAARSALTSVSPFIRFVIYLCRRISPNPRNTQTIMPIMPTEPPIRGFIVGKIKVQMPSF